MVATVVRVCWAGRLRLHALHTPRAGCARRVPLCAPRKRAPAAPPPRPPQVLPEAPRELVEELSRRYVHLYERITGQDFAPPPAGEPVADRIARALAGLQ